MTSKMKSEIKKAWLVGLIKYKQGRGKLCYETKNGPKWCCLGVLRDVALEGKWIKQPESKIWTSKGGDPNGEELTDNELKKLGLDSYDAELLMTFNDVHRWSFLQISAWIKKNI